MVGFLRLCQHFAKKKREMESQAANMAGPPCKARTQTVVVRSSAEKRRRKPPKMDQSVQCSDVRQQSVQQGARRSGQSDGVDVSEEEERELEKRLSKLQELLEESDDESDSEDDFDAEIESALEGVEEEMAAGRSGRTDLFVVSAKTAAVLSVDVAVTGEQSDPESPAEPDFSSTKGIN